MTIGYDIFDRMYELTKHPDDLAEQAAIRADLATYDQETRDELLRYAERLALAWKDSPGGEPFAGLWQAFAEEVRRAGKG